VLRGDAQQIISNEDKAMNKVKITLIAMSFLLFAGFYGKALPQAGSDSDKPVFADQATLLRPQGYREWIFVGSSLGLSYAQNPAARAGGAQLYHNTYINPSAYREFVKTGKFPEGTTMVLELLTQEQKQEPGLQGSYEKEVVGIEASVKDSTRFKEQWAYFNFIGPGGQPLAKARAFAKEACWSCHDVNAQTDHVFTQFYPALREFAAKK
jgi:hypothetical protein